MDTLSNSSPVNSCSDPNNLFAGHQHLSNCHDNDRIRDPDPHRAAGPAWLTQLVVFTDDIGLADQSIQLAEDCMISHLIVFIK